MSKIIVFANQKGGVGKTTSSVNVAAGLALAQKRVLLVDMDPQGNASYALTGREHPDTNMYQVLCGTTPLKNILVPAPLDGLTVAPSDLDLAGAEVELPQAVGGQLRLHTALRDTKDYDYIIIDAPPSLGILTINALAAAHGVIIPVDCGFFSLRGIVRLEQTIEKVQAYLGSNLRIFGVLCTMYDNTNVARDAVIAIRKRFGAVAFNTSIPRNVKLEEAHSRATHIFDYAADSSGARAYRELVQEVEDRG
jgi:chromosome partitioning protein